MGGLVTNKQVMEYFDKCTCITNAQRRVCDNTCSIVRVVNPPESLATPIEAPKYYDNSKGSLYLFAEQQGLNAYEFELIKRIVRCRKKGEFISDLEKTKTVIDIYLKEQGDKYVNQVEKLNG